MTGKEIAKFLAGALTWEALGHTLFALAGILPLNMFGLNLTPTLNYAIIVIAAILAVALGYYGWGGKEAASS